tara:strand:+ start:9316 stop:10287 length:972 start_codon:yes stop_codon:yes gene_type:complete
VAKLKDINEMKFLFENWREFNFLNEKINSLSSDPACRFVADCLVEVAKVDDILIPEREMVAIRKWGKLEGSPIFLGSGSRGSAYKFGDRVLKFTHDRSEVSAAALLVGKAHPNVYNVYAVGKRNRQNLENSDLNFKHAIYIIVYEFLEYPTRAMALVAQLLNEKIRSSKDGSLFYSWGESNLSEAKELIREFVKSVKEDPSLLGEPSEKFGNILPKIEVMARSLGWSNRQHKLFEISWTLIGGAYTQNLNSPVAVERYASKIIVDSRLDYFHQLALGLTFLKSVGVIFDDLKNTNVMQKNGQVVIIDVGKSRVQKRPEIPEIS